LLGAYVGIQHGWPTLPPSEAAEWLPVIALATGVAGVVDSTCQIPRWLRALAAWTLIALAIGVLLSRVSEHTMSFAAKLGWLAVLAAVASAWWFAVDELARESPGVAVPRDLLIVVAASSLVLMMSGSSLFGQLAGALATSLCVFALVGIFAQVSLARGGVLVFAALLVGLLICGHHFAYLTRTNGVLLLVAAVMTGARRVSPMRALSGWTRHCVQSSLVAVPAGIALVLAAIKFAESMSQPSYGY
jgi:hypothetical protein